MKKIKLPAADAVQSFRALQQLGNTNVKLSVAVTIAENIKALKTGCDVYYERRNEKIKELGERTDNGQWQVRQENLEAFQDFDEALGQEEITFSITQVSVANLPDSYEITPNIMAALIWMFDTRSKAEEPTQH